MKNLICYEFDVSYRLFSHVNYSVDMIYGLYTYSPEIIMNDEFISSKIDDHLYYYANGPVYTQMNHLMDLITCTGQEYYSQEYKSTHKINNIDDLIRYNDSDIHEKDWNTFNTRIKTGIFKHIHVNNHHTCYFRFAKIIK